MPKSPQSNALLEVIQNEEMLAFFTFQQPAGVGTELTGLAKIARPSADNEGSPVNYLSITFIADTPSEAVFHAARALFAKATAADFQRHVPGVRAITSLPATSFFGPHYVHQLDVIFGKTLPDDMRTLVSQLTMVVRHGLALQTEAPQFWTDASMAPKKTEAEKANLGARLKALLEALTR